MPQDPALVSENGMDAKKFFWGRHRGARLFYRPLLLMSRNYRLYRFMQQPKEKRQKKLAPMIEEYERKIDAILPQVERSDVIGRESEFNRLWFSYRYHILQDKSLKELSVPSKVFIIKGESGSGKTTLVTAFMRDAYKQGLHNGLVLQVDKIRAAEVLTKWMNESSSLLAKRLDADLSRPSIVFIDEAQQIAVKNTASEDATGVVKDSLEVESELLQRLDQVKGNKRLQTIVLLATDRYEALSEPIRRRAELIDLDTNVDEAKRIELTHKLCEKYGITLDPSAIESVIVREMAALGKANTTYSDINSCFEAVVAKAESPIREGTGTKRLEIQLADFKTVAAQVMSYSEETKESIAKDAKVRVRPEETYEDVGGLDGIKEKIFQEVAIALKGDLAGRMGYRAPKGFLFHGAPGTGKTLLAKAIANETKANFYYVSAPSILNKWVGASEKRLRDVFAEARKDPPSLLFIDEIDSIGRSRNGESNDGGVSYNVLTTLLTEMDGFGTNHGRTVVIAASVTGDTPIIVRSVHGKNKIRIMPIEDFVSLIDKNDASIKWYRTLARYGYNGARWSEIGSVYKHHVDHIFRIKYTGGEICCTEDHSVFVREKGKIFPKMVRDLKVGAELIPLETTRDLFPRNPKGRTVKVPERKKHSPTYTSFPSRVALSADFAKLLGYYVAEGSVKHVTRNVGLGGTFSFGSHEDDKIREVCDLLGKEFHVPSSVRTHKNGSEVNIDFPTQVGRLFSSLCGYNSHGKHVPRVLFHASPEVVSKFIDAYFAGDGYTDKRQQRHATTVSKRLAVEINWLCRMLGYHSHFTKVRYKGYGKGGIAYKITIARNDWLKGHKRVKVKSISYEPYNGFVYDLCDCSNQSFFGGENPILLHNTNRKDTLDPALLERFNRHFEFTMPRSTKEKLEVIAVHLRRLQGLLGSDVTEKSVFNVFVKRSFSPRVIADTLDLAAKMRAAEIVAAHEMLEAGAPQSADNVKRIYKDALARIDGSDYGEIAQAAGMPEKWPITLKHIDLAMQEVTKNESWEEMRNMQRIYIDKESRVGRAYGLSTIGETGAIGSILILTANLYKAPYGEGKVKVYGNAGKGAQESAEMAVAYMRQYLPQISAYDVFVHIISAGEGTEEVAVSGPSAGQAMGVAISSEALRVIRGVALPVASDITFTGKIEQKTARAGWVGGIHPKNSAAKIDISMAEGFARVSIPIGQLEKLKTDYPEYVDMAKESGTEILGAVDLVDNLSYATGKTREELMTLLNGMAEDPGLR